MRFLQHGDVRVQHGEVMHPDRAQCRGPVRCQPQLRGSIVRPWLYECVRLVSGRLRQVGPHVVWAKL